MPLPASDPNMVWPSKNLTSIRTAMERHAAWWANDAEQLQAAYGAPTADGTGFFASQEGGFRAGVRATVRRWFVGQQPSGKQQSTKLPVPIGSEICQASADLLFSDRVTVTADDKAAQERLDVLLQDDFYTSIAEAAEAAAALGGVYLRATWDPAVEPDGPFTSIVHADQAVPEFSWGRLTAVTFWTVVARDGLTVWRHLERHELQAGVGVILHGLYQGEDDRLGVRVTLTARPETASLANMADLNVEGTITTASPGLAIEYVPNQTPNRRWRHHPVGRNLGRSDLDGIEPLMDELAETMSDWMRARRVARARIMLSKQLLKNQGPGAGTIADTSQEVFQSVDMLAGKDMKLADQIDLLQPLFDPTGYQATAHELIEQIIRDAGYSTQTFGIDDGTAGDVTATEVESNERRSLLTRKRKIREWKPALERHITKLLAIDAALFSNPSMSDGVQVDFSDGVQETQRALSATVLALYQSESASVYERVSIMHPDWDETQILEEVGKITAEFAHALPAMEVAPPDAEPGQ